MPNETTRCRNVFDKKTANFLLHPPPMSLDIHSAIYFYLCISVDKAKQNEINLVATYPVKALFTRDILAHNISIKRYCDIKINRHFHLIFFPVPIEKIYIYLFEKILKCYYNILKKKYFYCNIFL